MGQVGKEEAPKRQVGKNGAGLEGQEMEYLDWGLDWKWKESRGRFLRGKGGRLGWKEAKRNRQKEK